MLDARWVARPQALNTRQGSGCRAAWQWLLLMLNVLGSRWRSVHFCVRAVQARLFPGHLPPAVQGLPVKVALLRTSYMHDASKGNSVVVLRSPYTVCRRTQKLIRQDSALQVLPLLVLRLWACLLVHETAHSFGGTYSSASAAHAAACCSHPGRCPFDSARLSVHLAAAAAAMSAQQAQQPAAAGQQEEEEAWHPSEALATDHANRKLWLVKVRCLIISLVLLRLSCKLCRTCLVAASSYVPAAAARLTCTTATGVRGLPPHTRNGHPTRRCPPLWLSAGRRAASRRRSAASRWAARWPRCDWCRALTRPARRAPRTSCSSTVGGWAGRGVMGPPGRQSAEPQRILPGVQCYSADSSRSAAQHRWAACRSRGVAPTHAGRLPTPAAPPPPPPSLPLQPAWAAASPRTMCCATPPNLQTPCWPSLTVAARWVRGGWQTRGGVGRRRGLAAAEQAGDGRLLALVALPSAHRVFRVRPSAPTPASEGKVWQKFDAEVTRRGPPGAAGGKVRAQQGSFAGWAGGLQQAAEQDPTLLIPGPCRSSWTPSTAACPGSARRRPPPRRAQCSTCRTPSWWARPPPCRHALGRAGGGAGRRWGEPSWGLERCRRQPCKAVLLGLRAPGCLPPCSGLPDAPARSAPAPLPPPADWAEAQGDE